MLEPATLLTTTRLLLTSREAARALGITERTLYAAAVERGEIPRVMVTDRAIRYAADDLRLWIDSRKVSPTVTTGAKD